MDGHKLRLMVVGRGDYITIVCRNKEMGSEYNSSASINDDV